MIYTETGYCAGCAQQGREIERLRRELDGANIGMQIREKALEQAEARLAKVVEAGQQICDFAVAWEPLSPGDIAEFRAALAAAQHLPGCLAADESETDKAIRLVNVGPCGCECAAAPQKEEP